MRFSFLLAFLLLIVLGKIKIKMKSGTIWYWFALICHHTVASIEGAGTRRRKGSRRPRRTVTRRRYTTTPPPHGKKKCLKWQRNKKICGSRKALMVEEQWLNLRRVWILNWHYFIPLDSYFSSGSLPASVVSGGPQSCKLSFCSLLEIYLYFFFIV